MEESKENFKKIKSANQMMLDYFNKSFLSQMMAWIPSATRSFRSRSKTCNP